MSPMLLISTLLIAGATGVAVWAVLSQLDERQVVPAAEELIDLVGRGGDVGLVVEHVRDVGDELTDGRVVVDEHDV